jgi:predicted glutamine amidotransferase
MKHPLNSGILMQRIILASSLIVIYMLRPNFSHAQTVTQKVVDIENRAPIYNHTYYSSYGKDELFIHNKNVLRTPLNNQSNNPHYSTNFVNNSVQFSMSSESFYITREDYRSGKRTAVYVRPVKKKITLNLCGCR